MFRVRFLACKFKPEEGYNRGACIGKIVESIRGSVAVPFERVVFAIGIRFVGETTAKQLARHFRSMEALSHATLEELQEVEGIGLVIAQSVVDYFHEPRNVEVISRLRAAGVLMQLSDIQGASDKLKDLSIVISGVFTHHSRDEYKALIELHGGKNVGSISAKTSFILAGDNMGPAKLEKAQKLGVRIVSEDEFINMIQ